MVFFIPPSDVQFNFLPEDPSKRCQPADPSRTVRLFQHYQFIHLHCESEAAVKCTLDMLGVYYQKTWKSLIDNDHHTVFGPCSPHAIRLPAGLMDRVINNLHLNGLDVVRYTAQWKEQPADVPRGKEGLEVRPIPQGAHPLLQSVLRYDRGQYIMPSMEMIQSLLFRACRSLPRARILLTSPSKQLLNRIVWDLRRRMNCRIHGPRIRPHNLTTREMFYCTTGTLYVAPQWYWDYVFAIGDGSLVTEDRYENLIHMHTHRFHTFLTKAVTDRQRAFNLECLSGPIRHDGFPRLPVKYSDQQGVNVSWRNPIVPVTGETSAGGNPEFLRHIASTVNSCHEQYGQTLVYANSLRQAFELQAILRCGVLHEPLSSNRLTELQEVMGPRHTIALSDSRELNELASAFNKGSERLMIISPSANLRKSLRYLGCVVRADTDADESQDDRLIQLLKSVVNQGKALQLIDFRHPETLGLNNLKARLRKKYAEAGFRLPNLARKAASPALK